MFVELFGTPCLDLDVWSSNFAGKNAGSSPTYLPTNQMPQVREDVSQQVEEARKELVAENRVGKPTTFGADVFMVKNPRETTMFLQHWSTCLNVNLSWGGDKISLFPQLLWASWHTIWFCYGFCSCFHLIFSLGPTFALCSKSPGLTEAHCRVGRWVSWQQKGWKNDPKIVRVLFDVYIVQDWTEITLNIIFVCWDCEICLMFVEITLNQMWPMIYNNDKKFERGMWSFPRKVITHKVHANASGTATELCRVDTRPIWMEQFPTWS